jgi:hypothetical protein
MAGEAHEAEGQYDCQVRSTNRAIVFVHRVLTTDPEWTALLLETLQMLGQRQTQCLCSMQVQMATHKGQHGELNQNDLRPDQIGPLWLIVSVQHLPCL